MSVVVSRISGADWSQRYEEGTIPWDKGYGAPPLKEFLDRRKVEGKVLVPGCGRGHDCRLLAGQGAEVVGLDISVVAVELARAMEQTGHETYAVGDFLDPDADFGRYDFVFEHTCLCAINPDERNAYVHAVCKALKPRGHLLAIFYVEIEDSEGPPFPISTGEIDELFYPFFETIESWMPTQTYPERAGREQMRVMRKK